METRDERGRRHGPESIGLLHHVQLRVSPEVNLGLGGAGCIHPELDLTRGVDARIFRTPDIGGSRRKLI